MAILSLRHFCPVLVSVDYKSVERIKNLKEADLIKEYLDLLYDGDLTLEDIEAELTGSLYAKAAARLKAVTEKRQQFLTLEFINRMKQENAIKTVIYLYGKAGYGKTKLARRYAENLHANYFITGSSRDPFQGYHNQETVIIDELRQHTFHYDDLLKLLDPYNFDVMIPSRYYDKALTAKTLFITSPFSPKQLYDAIFQEQSRDNFEQLERRLACVIRVDKDTLYEMTYSSNHMAYVPIDGQSSPNPFKDEHEAPKDKQLFQEFITTIKKEEKEEIKQYDNDKQIKP
ncbi:RNA helicase domain-containing protein [Streptococcus thoraltensis]|uniref:RNA helicase domain-containing protein n=1 Tax=Streptococcus thoraltensis TaxID=55085 RepID=UPI001F564FCB|nr:RNA helicase domain-containing protein [Streptococcus thoraltensis]